MDHSLQCTDLADIDIHPHMSKSTATENHGVLTSQISEAVPHAAGASNW